MNKGLAQEKLQYLLLFFWNTPWSSIEHPEVFAETKQEKTELLQNTESFLTDILLLQKPMETYVNRAVRDLSNRKEENAEYQNYFDGKFQKEHFVKELNKKLVYSRELDNYFCMTKILPSLPQEYLNFAYEHGWTAEDCHFLSDLMSQEKLQTFFTESSVVQVWIQEFLDTFNISERKAKERIELYLKALSKNHTYKQPIQPYLAEFFRLTGKKIKCNDKVITLPHDPSEFVQKLLPHAETLITYKVRSGKWRKKLETKCQTLTEALLYDDPVYLQDLKTQLGQAIESVLKLGKYVESEEIKDRLAQLLNRFLGLDLLQYDKIKGYRGVFLEDVLGHPDSMTETILYGFTYAVTHSYITTDVETKLQKILPKHPKDEYPLARAMERRVGEDGEHLRKVIIHVGGTNSGKTYESIQDLASAKTGCYCGPLRLLALEVQQTLNETYHVPTSLLTGVESQILPEATHISCTVEKIDLTQEYEVCVLDEFQLAGDKDRGFAYMRILLGILAKRIHVCTAPESLKILCKILDDCGTDYEMKEHNRTVPLYANPKCIRFPQDLTPATAVICFSKKKVLQVAAYLEEQGYHVNILYGSLPHQVRWKQLADYERANKGIDKRKMTPSKKGGILVATDCIGLGMNISIHNICILDLKKFNGETVVPLGPSLAKQICGRAGRRGIYEEGYFCTTENPRLLKEWVEQKTPDIEKVYVGFPQDIVLEIPYGIDDILKVWKNLELKSDLYTRMNIERYLTLYEQLDFLTQEEKQNKEMLLKFLNIPFDEYNPQLLQLWKHYISSWFHDGEIYFGEECENNDLEELETYYKKLDLFYSFCRNIHAKEEEYAWVEQEKEEVSDKINTLLIDHLQQIGTKRCLRCGRPISPLKPFQICSHCFSYRY